jgi:hypothetical protein
VRLTAASLQLDGYIYANGGAYRNPGSTGGSGGGIKVTVGALSGSGGMQANAGNYEAGGGRVAVFYETNTNFNLGNLWAKGNGYGTFGGAGTVFTKSTSQANGDLRIDNGGVNTVVPGTPVPGGSFDQFTVRAGASAALPGTVPLVVPSLTLANNATLTHSESLAVDTQTPTSDSALILNVQGEVAIDATSKIDVSGKGYLGGLSGGNASMNGRTQGNVVASQASVGGSYGGPGYSSSNNPMPLYGDYKTPGELGSGGSASSSTSPGGNGGGRVSITAGSLALEGKILANGAGTSGFGGSGGALLLNVASIRGAGSVEARGGYQGGGGRIAVYAATNAGFDLTKLTAGGGQYAGAGTVYWEVGSAVSDPFAELIHLNMDEAADSTTFLNSGAFGGSLVSSTSLPVAGAPGLSGYGIDFVGDAVRRHIHGLPNIEPQSLTLVVWLNLRGNAGSYPSHLVQKVYRMGLDWNNPWLSTGIDIDRNSNQPVFLINTNSGGRGWFVFAPGISYNAWHMLALTYDGARFKSYIDGVKVSDVAKSGPIDYGTHGYWQLGSANDGSGAIEPLNGILDDFRVFGRALSEAEIAQLYSGN